MFSVMITIGILAVPMNNVKADIVGNFLVTNCANGGPLENVMIHALTGDPKMGSDTQATTNADGKAKMNTLRPGDIVHIFKFSALGYIPTTVSLYIPAWTTQEVEVCLDKMPRPQLPANPQGRTTQPARTSS